MDWTRGDPECNQSIGWHARKADWLRETIGPMAELEFEQQHPEPEEDC